MQDYQLQNYLTTMVKKIKTTEVSKSDYKNYRGKGLELFSVMRMCLEDRQWDAVLVNGIHSVISLNDALCVFKLGKRSTSQSHQDAAILLGQACPEEEGRKNTRRLSEILNEKNEIEYLPKRFTEKEARSFSTKIERFVNWAEKQLP